MAVLGGGGRSSPVALLASISALMRFSTCAGHPTLNYTDLLKWQSASQVVNLR